MHFTGKVISHEPQEGHFILFRFTTNLANEISAEWNEALINGLELRHLQVIKDALEDSFYRVRPDLRRQ